MHSEEALDVAATVIDPAGLRGTYRNGTRLHGGALLTADDPRTEDGAVVTGRRGGREVRRNGLMIFGGIRM